MRRLAIIGLLCIAFLALAVPATAHTALETSTPADGSTVDRAVRRVVLTFNEPIEPAGQGAQLLDSSGTTVDADVTVDGAVVTVRPAEPLTSGGHGVGWAVRSGDGHPVRGTVRFTVDAAATHGAGDTAHDAPAVRDGPAAATADHAAPAGGAQDAQHGGADDVAMDAALASALAADATRPLELIDAALRAVFYAVALSAMGVATFLLGAWEGPRREVRLLCRMIVRLALATAVVVVAQILVRSALDRRCVGRRRHGPAADTHTHHCGRRRAAHRRRAVADRGHPTGATPAAGRPSDRRCRGRPRGGTGGRTAARAHGGDQWATRTRCGDAPRRRRDGRVVRSRRPRRHRRTTPAVHRRSCRPTSSPPPRGPVACSPSPPS